VIEQHGDDIVRLLRGERETLSRQECMSVAAPHLVFDDLLMPDVERSVRTTTIAVPELRQRS
jgi:hypothetical protein